MCLVALFMVLAAALLTLQSDPPPMPVKAKLAEPPDCSCKARFSWNEYQLELSYLSSPFSTSIISPQMHNESDSLTGIKLSRNTKTLLDEKVNVPATYATIGVVTIDGLPEIAINTGSSNYLVAFDRSKGKFLVKPHSEEIRVVLARGLDSLEPVPAINRPALPSSALEITNVRHERTVSAGPVRACLRLRDDSAADLRLNCTLAGTFEGLTIRRQNSTFEFRPICGYQHVVGPALFDVDADGEPEIVLYQEGPFDPKTVIYKYSPQDENYREHIISGVYFNLDIDKDQIPEFIREDELRNPLNDEVIYSRLTAAHFRNGRMNDIYPKLSRQHQAKLADIMEGG